MGMEGRRRKEKNIIWNCYTDPATQISHGVSISIRLFDTMNLYEFMV